MNRLLCGAAALCFLAAEAAPVRACEPGAAVVPFFPSGALVTSVDPGGSADQLGIMVGDVIFLVNGMPINSQEDLDRAFAPCPRVVHIVLERSAVDDDPPVDARVRGKKVRIRIDKELPRKRKP
jgi:S1-C subfamily serine protease